ncbi:MAG: hypothetical protein HOI95_13445 [Chromatiales bacterium]|nr:hypothetical protein [Chromatiales bacterium]
MWNVVSGNLEATLTGEGGAVYAAVLGHDGHGVFVGLADGPITLWDRRTKNQIATFRDHDDAVQSMALSADGDHLVSGSVDTMVRLWSSIPRTMDELSLADFMSAGTPLFTGSVVRERYSLTSFGGPDSVAVVHGPERLEIERSLQQNVAPQSHNKLARQFVMAGGQLSNDRVVHRRLARQAETGGLQGAYVVLEAAFFHHAIAAVPTLLTATNSSLATSPSAGRHWQPFCRRTVSSGSGN